MPLSHPDLDYTFDGLLHRKWVYPARRYNDGGGQGERWVYGVGAPPCVVTFSISTGRYPEGCIPGVPFAIAETLHRADAGEHACIYLDGMGCGNDGSGIDANEWYAAQPKNAQGFVADADVFTHLRDLYARWSQP
jgi:hypothetical protein